MDFDIPEDLKMIQSLVRDFVRDQLKPLERDLLGRAAGLKDARSRLPQETEKQLMDMAKGLGLWGLGVPENLGGAGLNTLGNCLVEEELAQTAIPFSFGDVTPILFDCSEEQRGRFLTPLLEGDKGSYIALMEPGRGNDPLAMKTKAAKDDGGYVLNGKKITFSQAAPDYFAIVFALTGQGTASGRERVTCFLVDKDVQGFSVRGGGETTGWRSQLRQPLLLEFDECRLSAADVLGEEGRAFHLGESWLPARRITRGARCVGAAQRLLEEAVAQAQGWQSFGQSIAGRPNVEAALADIALSIHSSRLLVYHAAWKADREELTKRDAAVVKIFTVQMIRQVADRVSHIFAGPPGQEALPMLNLFPDLLSVEGRDPGLDVQRKIVAADLLKGLKI
mgnify:CR=1 FL=1